MSFLKDFLGLAFALVVVLSPISSQAALLLPMPQPYPANTGGIDPRYVHHASSSAPKKPSTATTTKSQTVNMGVPVATNADRDAQIAQLKELVKQLSALLAALQAAILKGN